jgi:hypothetical protein
MAVHFALRPRLRLDEEVMPLPRAARFELPSVALPVAGYWLALGVFTYALIHVIHNERAPEDSEGSVELAATADMPVSENLPVAASLPSDPGAAAADLEPARAETAPEPPAPPPAYEAAPRADVLDPQAPRAEPPPLRPPRAELEHRRSAAAAGPPPERESATRSEAPAVPQRESSPEPFVAALAPRESSRAANALPSCEAASASYRQQIDFAGAPGAPDVSQQAFASVLENGAYLSGCGVPETTALEICVAVQEGRAKGITVVARPASARISGCVRRAVASLRFPYSSKLDVTHTRFEALPRR